jgi:hypothetical protein
MFKWMIQMMDIWRRRIWIYLVDEREKGRKET